MPENSYNYIYLPNHHKAHQDGCVYEHIIVAERMLGRLLSDEEKVHHEDRNRKNNSPDNLIVFATNADHSRYHKTGIKVLEGDHYISPKKLNYCPVCGKINNNIFCSQKCFKESQKRFNPSKEELEQDILNLSLVKVGEKYGVSDNAVRHRLKAFDLPYTLKGIKEFRKYCGVEKSVISPFS